MFIELINAQLLQQISSNQYQETTLYIRGQEDDEQSDDLNIINLCQALASNSYIRCLILTDVYLLSPSIRALATCTTIKALSLNYAYLKDFHIKIFTKYNSTIEELQLEGNFLGAESARLLAKLPNLKRLYLDGNEIGDEGAIALAANNTLQELDVANADIGDAGFMALAQNSSLKLLNLSGHFHIASESYEAIAKNPNLQSLFLQNCGITDNEAQIIAQFTKVNFLELGYNSISDIGAEYLAANTAIKALMLPHNKLSEKSVFMFVLNTSLFHLNLDDNSNMPNDLDLMRLFLYNDTLNSLSFAPDPFDSYSDVDERLRFNYLAWLAEIFNLCQNKVGPDVALQVLSFIVNPEDKEELFYQVRHF